MLHAEAGHILLPVEPGDEGNSVCPYHPDCFEGLAAGPSIAHRWGAKGSELADRDEVWDLESTYIARGMVEQGILTDVADYYDRLSADLLADVSTGRQKKDGEDIVVGRVVAEKVMNGNTGENLLQLVERRLDNVVYRLGFASTRREARQLVNHGHFTVNGQRVNIPSYLVSVNDLVAVCEKSASNTRFKKMKEDDAFVAAPKWLERDKNNLSGKVIALPARDDIDFEIAENLIVELYSK